MEIITYIVWYVVVLIDNYIVVSVNNRITRHTLLSLDFKHIWNNSNDEVITAVLCVQLSQWLGSVL